MSGEPCPKIPRPPKVQRGLVRKPMQRKSKKRDNEFSQKVKDAATLRAGGKCEFVTPACDQRAYIHHHVLGRAQGGPGSLDNCAHICTSCHVYAHGHPSVAYERGWMIRGLRQAG